MVPESVEIPPPIPTNQGWIWLIFLLLHTFDVLLRRIGVLIQRQISKRYSMVVMGFLATLGAAFCSIDTMKESMVMIGCICLLLIADFIALYLQRHGYETLLGFEERARIYFAAYLFIVKAVGMISVLAGFVFLTGLVEEHQQQDWYSVGFFSCVFLNVTAIMKVLGAEDFLGVGDSIMALSVYLFIKFPESIQNFRASMWVTVCVLEMFKFAKIRRRELRDASRPIQAPTIYTRFKWSTFPGFAWKAQLLGHKKDIVGICIPKRSDRLYSASRDGILQVFSVPGFSLLRTEDLRGEIGSLLTRENWVFVGLRNGIQVYQDSHQTFLMKPETNDDMDALGLVTAMVFGKTLLFSGTIYGVIAFWRPDDTTPSGFSHLGSLPAHSQEVTCLTYKGMSIFSGYADGLIKVWSLSSLVCTASMTPHTDAVTSLLLWDEYLFSSSLDGTLRTFISDGRRWILHKSHMDENSIHALCGFYGVGDKRPMILCSAQNGTANIYDRETFGLRGTIFSTSTIETWATTSGLLFSGGRNGMLHAWTVHDS